MMPFALLCKTDATAKIVLGLTLPGALCWMWGGRPSCLPCVATDHLSGVVGGGWGGKECRLHACFLSADPGHLTWTLLLLIG